MRVTSFRRGSGEGRRFGTFDAEIAPGIILNQLALIRKPTGEFRVYGNGNGLFLKRHAEDALIALALAASQTPGGQHVGR